MAPPLPGKHWAKRLAWIRLLYKSGAQYINKRIPLRVQWKGSESKDHSRGGEGKGPQKPGKDGQAPRHHGELLPAQELKWGGNLSRNGEGSPSKKL